MLIPFLVTVCASESMTKISPAVQVVSRAKNVPAVRFRIVSGLVIEFVQVIVNLTPEAKFQFATQVIAPLSPSNATQRVVPSVTPP